MPWNPDQYHKFQAECSAPFDDLLAPVSIRPKLKGVDLGCGTGELTRGRADALPESDFLGFDNSPAMLERASAYARPGLRFELGDQTRLAGRWQSRSRRPIITSRTNSSAKRLLLCRFAPSWAVG